MSQPATNIVELGAHEKMTPEQALALCTREKWEDIVICGYHSGGGGLVVRSSHMSRELALWIAEHLKLHIIDG